MRIKRDLRHLLPRLTAVCPVSVDQGHLLITIPKKRVPVAA